jgi:hypothetical protein
MAKCMSVVEMRQTRLTHALRIQYTYQVESNAAQHSKQ